MSRPKDCFAHVGMEVFQAMKPSAQLTQKDFANALKVIPASPESWSSRRRPCLMEEVLICECKFGESRWLGTVAWPDICVCPAQLAARVNPLQGCDMYGIND